MKIFIKEMLSESGIISTTRFGFVNMVGMVWFIIICLIVMVFMKIITIDVYQVITLIGTLAGIFGAVKYAQKRVEVSSIKNYELRNKNTEQSGNGTKPQNTQN